MVSRVTKADLEKADMLRNSSMMEYMEEIGGAIPSQYKTVVRKLRRTKYWKYTDDDLYAMTLKQRAKLKNDVRKVV